MSEKLEIENAELRVAIATIWALRDSVTNLAQQVNEKTKREEILKDQVKQLEIAIDVQTRIHQDKDRRIGEEYTQLKVYIGNLILDLSEKSKRIQSLEEELVRESCVHRISETCFQKTPGAGHQANDKLQDSGFIAPDVEVNPVRYKEELERCHRREQLYAGCIDAQQIEMIELLKELAVANEEKNRLEKIITDMNTVVQEKKLELAEELEKRRLLKEKHTPPTAGVFQGSSKQKYNVADTLVLNKKLAETQQENERLTTRIRILESQISAESKTIVTPRAMSPEMVKSVQQLHKLFLQHRDHRKALAFQKSYLVYATGLYQFLKNQTLLERTATTSSNIKSPRVRFRCTVFAIISICRMKWLITRWQKDGRASADTVLKKFEKSVYEISRQ